MHVTETWDITKGLQRAIGALKERVTASPQGEGWGIQGKCFQRMRHRKTRKCAPGRDVGAVEDGGDRDQCLSVTHRSDRFYARHLTCCLSLLLHSNPMGIDFRILFNSGGNEAQKS